MADVPPRFRRAHGSPVVARPLHRMVLRPLRGREDGRPEVPRRLADEIRTRARARKSRWRARSLERDESRARRGERQAMRRRPAAGLLPPPFAAAVPAERRLTARRGGRPAAAWSATGAPVL